jgi:hypothetical protein
MLTLTQATVHRLVPAYIAWVEHPVSREDAGRWLRDLVCGGTREMSSSGRLFRRFARIWFYYRRQGKAGTSTIQADYDKGKDYAPPADMTCIAEPGTPADEWLLTPDEYMAAHPEAEPRRARAMHEEIVRRAVVCGEPVPEQVLTAYYTPDDILPTKASDAVDEQIRRHERCAICYWPGHIVENCPANRPIPWTPEELEAAGIKPESRRRRPKGRIDGETPGTQLPPGEPEQLSLF